MDANELGRWTRFAAKGGIGKCLAVQDCVAEGEEDLMFLKDDEIIVLMHLPGLDDVFLGYCEGVVGRFRGSDVLFLGRLKKPVMTKRSSRSLSRSSSRPSSSQSSVPNLGRESMATAAHTHRDFPSLPQVASRNSYNYLASALTAADASPSVLSADAMVTSQVGGPNDSNAALPSSPPLSPPQLILPSIAPDNDSRIRSVSHSSTSTAIDSTPRTPADFAHGEPRSLVRIVSLSRQVDSPTSLHEESTTTGFSVGEHETKDAGSSRRPYGDVEEGTLLYTDFAPEEQEQGHEEHSASFLDSEASTRLSFATTLEGETGIGISLLQTFVNGEMDDGDGDGDGDSVHTENLDDSMTTIEGRDASVLMSVDEIDVSNVRSDVASSRSSVYSRASLHDAVRSSGSAAPSRTSMHPSGTDSDYGGEDWEGASDIYDNYRYSRASMASKMSRLSKGSIYTVASGLGLEAPPPIPTDSQRPSLDSLRHAAGAVPIRYGSAAPALASVEDLRRTGKAPEADHASSPSEGTDGRGSQTPARRVPPPLDLASSSYNRLATPGTPSQGGFSPLLHTTFHSPLPTPPGLHSPTFLSPLSSPSTTPLYSNTPGGAASALRQRLELGRTSPSAPVTRDMLSPSSTYEQVSSSRARLSTQPIVVADDGTEAATATATATVSNEDRDVDSMSPMASPTSATAFDSVPEKKRLLETAYFVANQPPPPPYTPMFQSAGPSASGPQDVFSPQSQPASLQSVPGSPISGQPQSPTHAFARRSIFLPHPHAPKPADVPSGGPMYGRAPVAAPAPNSPTRPMQGSLTHALHMVLMSRNDPFRTPALTIYANFERELTSSIGPVPVTFSLERPTHTSAPRAAQPLAVPSPSDAQPPRVHTSPLSSGQPIPRPNFDPRAQGPRPRSRSLSDYDISTSDPSPVMRSPSLNKPGSPTPSPSLVSASEPSSPVTSGPRNPHKPLPLSLPPNNAKGTAFSSRPSPSPLSRPPLTSARSPSPMSPVAVDVETSTPSDQSTDAKSPMSGVVPLPSTDSVQSPISPVSRSMSSSTAHSSSSSPLMSRARGLLRHSRSSTFSNKARDRSPQSRSSLQGRRSVETDASHQSDSRSANVASPPPLTSLRSKLSLPTLKIKAGGERFANIEERSPTASVAPSEAVSEQPTVHIKDVDFELVNPSQQLTIIDEDPATASLPSPMRPDFSSSLRAASPVLSMKSGSSTRTGMAQPAPNAPPVLASPPAPPPGSTQQVEAHRQRELRWITAMASTPASQARKSKKLRKLLYEGVPSSVRYLVWAHLTDSKARRMDNLYTKLMMREQVTASASIERDVQRVFAEESQLLDGSLMNILQAYLSMVPDVQYSRGLTVIAGRLLLQSPEEDAFWTFVSLMDTHLRLYFSPSRSQLEVDSTLFGKAVDSNEPALARKLFTELDIPPISLCRPWFTALFLEALPFEHSQRVWDIFLFEGVTFLFRVGLAIIQCCKPSISTTSDRDAILNMLLHPSSAMLPASSDALIEMASTLKFKDEDVRKQRTKLEAQNKQARHPGLQGGTAAIIPLRPSMSNISLPRRQQS